MSHQRRKHRLPKNFGSIRYLGEGRRNPYAVHPPGTQSKDDSAGKGGCRKREKAICYVPDWETGFKVLALIHAGLYEKGMEVCPEEKLESMLSPDEKMIAYARKILMDIETIRAGGDVMSPSGVSPGEEVRGKKHTFKDVYDSFIEHKFGTHAHRKLTKDTRNAYNSAWQKLKPLYGRTLDEVNIDMLEGLVNELADQDYSKSTVERSVTLIRALFKYAYTRGYCSSDVGLHLEKPATRAETHHQDFTDEELQVLWNAYDTSDDAFVVDVTRMILINCYCGFRIREFENLKTFLDEDGKEGYFQGGFKTEAGRNRIVPIHSLIMPLVRELVMTDETGECSLDNNVGSKEVSVQFLCGKKHSQFRRDMKKVLADIGVDVGNRAHTPHSCRHTFSRLCESYSVNEADRKRMLGHSLHNDVTNGVYGHRTVKELRLQIEKIKKP